MKTRDPHNDKRTQILTAATTLLTVRGVQALSFENVAEEAGLSRQLVRYYYCDLDTLIVELSDHLGNIYRDMLVAGIVKIREVERLGFFLDFFFDLADGHPMPGNIAVYDALVACSVGSSALRDRMCDQYRSLGSVIVYELAIAHPELDGHACEELSYLCVSMMHAHWSFVASLGHSRKHSLLTRRAIDRLIESYINDPSPVAMTAKPWTRET